jgi:aspartokinase
MQPKRLAMPKFRKVSIVGIGMRSHVGIASKMSLRAR